MSPTTHTQAFLQMTVVVITIACVLASLWVAIWDTDYSVVLLGGDNIILAWLGLAQLS